MPKGRSRRAMPLAFAALLFPLAVGARAFASAPPAAAAGPRAPSGETGRGLLLTPTYEVLAAGTARDGLAPPSAIPSVPTLEGPLSLDGVLDEPLWSRALAWRLGYERKVKLNGPARERTLFLMALTPSDLVLAFLCLDSDMAKLRATLTDRDADLAKEDHVAVALDSFGDERHAYQIYVNPLNVQTDSILEDRGQQDTSFDFVWDSATRLHPDGWVAEIRIPLKYLRHGSFPGRPALWRIGPGRSLPRDYLFLSWPTPFDPDRNCFLCQYPAVRVDLPSASGGALQVIPYAAGLHDERRDGTRESTADAGFDLKYQPSPSWILDATVRPDFSQVETDAFQITSNLRFQPYFDEKRPFFLERSDLFRSPLQVAYSRTILDPLFGLRATGKTGRSSFALLQARDQATVLLFPGQLTSSSALLADTPSDDTLFRYRYDLGGQARMGLLYTDRTYNRGHNRVLAFDGRWGVGREFLLETQAVGSRTAYPRSVAERFNQPSGRLSGQAAWIKLSHNGRSWDHSWELDLRSNDLRADLGFLQQVGTRKLSVTEWYHHWPKSGPVQDWGAYFEGHQTRGADGTLESKAWIGGNATLPGDTYLDLGYVYRQDRGARGLLSSTYGLLIWRTSPAGWFSSSGSVEAGQGVDYTLNVVADLLAFAATQEWRIWRRLVLSHAVSYRELSQRARLQDALVQRLRLEWQISPRLGFRQIAQLSRYRFPDPRFAARGLPPEESVREVQSLLRYRLNYGSALYAGVFARDDLKPTRQKSRGAFLKMAYLFNR